MRPYRHMRGTFSRREKPPAETGTSANATASINLKKPRDLMYVAAWDAEGFMVLPHGFSIGCLQQAVHLAIGIVEQLDLTNAELVGLFVFRVLRDLLDGLTWELEVIVEIHELGHRSSPYGQGGHRRGRLDHR